jgi:hypothetical protein
MEKIMPKKKIAKHKNKIILVVIFLILLSYGSFLRLYGLGQKSLWLDESISALAARNIYGKGVPVFDSGALYGRAYVFHYFMSSFLFFGQSDFNIRLVSFIFGIATCVLIFFIGKEYNDETAWIAFIFSLFLEIFIVYSQQARMYQMEMFFFFLTAYLLYKGLDDRKYFFFAIPAFILAYDTSPIALALIPFFLYVIFKNKMNKYYYIGLGLISFYFLVIFWHRLFQFDFIYLRGYVMHLKYYVPFLLISVVGIILGIKKKMTLFLGASLVLLLLGFASYTLFAFRYVYLAFLPLVIFASFTLSKIKFKWAVFFVYLIWISNIFVPITYTAVLKPQKVIIHNDPTAPQMDFKDFYDELGYEYHNEVLIVTLSAMAEWYLKKPDYWIYFSFTGLKVEPNETFSVHNGRDVYTGADIIYDLDDFKDIKGEKTVVIDDWSSTKIDSEIIKYLNTECSLIIEKKEVAGYRCLD